MMNTMNRYMGVLAVAGLMAGFAACSNDGAEVPTEDSCEIRLTSCIAAADTRGTTLDQQATAIATGQKIGVTITGARTAHDNVEWTVGSDGELTSSTSVLYQLGNPATIKAYHPYQAEVNGNSLEFSVKADQTGNDYLNSDLLWAEATATKQEDAVELTFAHKLAKINVKLTSKTVSSISATISICNTKPTTTFNLSDGSVSAEASGEVQDITAATNATQATAIVAPQTVAKGTNLIKVVNGGKTFYYALESDLTLCTGNLYSYTLELTEIGIKLVSGQITAWGEGTNTPFEAEATQSSYANNIAYVAKPGDLASVLSGFTGITTLKVNGYLNGNDFQTLKTMGLISTLDLSDAYIVEGGSYTDDYHNVTYSTYRNEFPKAVFYATSPENIILPQSITSIGAMAFYDCQSTLHSIVIPQNVTYIGDEAFYWCWNLASIHCKMTKPANLGENVFYLVSKATTCTIYVPKGSKSLYEKADQWREFTIVEE